MKRFFAALFFSILLHAAPSWAALPYPAVEFRDLSDRKISAEGEAALAMEPESWRHAESENFVYHFTDEREAETVLVHAETYFAWVREAFGVQGAPPGKKSHLFIFNDDKLWEEFRHRGTLERIAGAEAYTDGNELFIHRMQFWLEPLRVLAHELTHVVLFRLLDDAIPLYLNEGYAELIGARAVAMKFGGEEFLARSAGRVPEAYYRPLEDLAAVRVYPKGLEETRYFYLQSQLWVRYLIEKHGSEKFYAFLKSHVQFKSIAFALHHVYGLQLDEVEKSFRAYAVEPAASE